MRNTSINPKCKQKTAHKVGLEQKGAKGVLMGLPTEKMVDGFYLARALYKSMPYRRACIADRRGAVVGNLFFSATDDDSKEQQKDQ